MDITQLFKASVKTVRLKNKSQLLIQSEKNHGKIQIKEPNKKLKDLLFYQKSKNISYQVTQLRNFLIENRASYMKFACHLKRSQQMSDEERDVIDSESEKILKICFNMINDLKVEIRKNQKLLSKQLNQHLDGVIDLITEYLKNVNKIYSEQKHYRIQRDLESYKLLKLNSDKKKSLIPVTNNLNHNERRSDSENDDLENENQDKLENDPKDQNIGLRKRKNRPLASKLSLDDEITNNQLAYNYEEDDISAEDIQMFESENVQLFNELVGLSEEVEQIEKNVVDIAKLQEIFTEKVTLQKHDIERIANTVVGATENVRDANEQIKQAIQRNAGLRVYILFFLIVMSFSLLFLDWYND